LANDLFQETFIKVINTLKAGTYNEEGKFLPWVMRIAHNLIIDYFRKRKKNNTISESFSFSNEYSIFHKISNGDKDYTEKIGMLELEEQMVKLVDCLPVNQKSIVRKRLFQGMSFKDIAEEESISINTALGRMRYAIINIRKIIDKKGIVVSV
jgi:RNA polymerase sigma-70 factor (ECF subfamily)